MKPVYLVIGKRTPQAKAGMEMKDIPVPYLGYSLLRSIMDDVEIPNNEVDEVIIGCNGSPAKFSNIGRVIALEGGLDKETSAYTVMRNCAAGLEAVSEAYIKIASGRSNIIFAGGVESMSQMPLMFGKDMTELFIKLMFAKTTGAKLKALMSFRLPHLTPIVAVQMGLTDPFKNINMGQTAEIIAREFGITREMQDEYANNSHHKAVRAEKEGRWKDEILPIIGSDPTKLLALDYGPRENSTVESLAKMKPYFERETGTVTVGNSCPLTDGGSMWLMASEEGIKRYNLKPMARMVDYHFHGIEPERMGLGPVPASHGVLKRANMKMSDMDLVELNEAFAAQVLGCLMAFKDKNLSSRWGIYDEIGEVPLEKVNVNGGGIALGHPVGSTGCRIMITLAHELKRRKQRYGLATLCIGGGQGGATIIENLG